MMKMRRRDWPRPAALGALLLAAALWSPAGCSSKGSGTAPASGSGDIDALIDAICRAARDCCGRAGFPLEPVANCESELVRQTEFTPLLERGTVLIDQPGLASCVDAYRRAADSCSGADLRSACAVLFEGTREAGQPCSDSLECKMAGEPVVCVKMRGDAGDDPSEGVCVRPPRGAEGDECLADCRPNEPCRIGLSTSRTEAVTTLCHEVDGLYCAASCQRILDSGAACTSSSSCAKGLRCDTTCVPGLAAGSACTSGDDCLEGLACIEGQCASLPFATEKICSGDFN
jgi:hypothetical protein